MGEPPHMMSGRTGNRRELTISTGKQGHELDHGRVDLLEQSADIPSTLEARPRVAEVRDSAIESLANGVATEECESNLRFGPQEITGEHVICRARGRKEFADYAGVNEKRFKGKILGPYIICPLCLCQGLRRHVCHLPLVVEVVGG